MSVIPGDRLLAREAKTGHTKAAVGNFRVGTPPNPDAAPEGPNLLKDLDAEIVASYPEFSIVEVNEKQKDVLKRRGNAASILVTLRDEFDRIFINGQVLDAREPKQPPAGETHDPPYKHGEEGTWIVQFVGPAPEGWLDALKSEGVVPIQYISYNAFIVVARDTAIHAIERLPYVQWTSQMHRFLKPSIRNEAGQPTVRLWVQLAQTESTADVVGLLHELSEGGVESAPWSAVETRVEGTFSSEDIPVILAQPLVIGLAERPEIALSDERAVLGVTEMVPGTATAGLYKKWLNDLCPSCMNLKDDGFYVGIADSGLDGGDRVASGNGTLPGERASSDLHRDELPKSRVVWGASFEKRTFDAGQSWTNCVNNGNCPDTTESKHDVYGHGTLVAGMVAGDPLPNAAKDAGGFLWGLGVAPSAGLLITKINARTLVDSVTPVRAVTRDARSATSPHAYWQNFSMNQYASAGSSCSQLYDGAYTVLSRDFDFAVRDGDIPTAGDQQITLTVSAGNIAQQGLRTSCTGFNRILTLPPATAKNVIAIGGGENVQPDPWLCAGTLAHDYQNLSIDAKHGTRYPGYFKPDLVAVSSSIASLVTSDQEVLGTFCRGASEPAVPSPYRASSGTSFAAPIGAASAALASRRFRSNPAAATPALVKAMLVAGSRSMRGGRDRASLTLWANTAPILGWRVIPTTPNGHYYEIEALAAGPNSQRGASEPIWPTDGTAVTDGCVSCNTHITWRDKGPEPQVGSFPNDQQGFGRIALADVLSEYPARAFVNQEHPLALGQAWTGTYKVHDSRLPVRVALVWTDAPAFWSSGDFAQNPPLVNDLDLSVLVTEGGACAGRYVGNDLGANEESVYHPSCTGGTMDTKNNVEIARFFATAGRGDTTFTVRVDSVAGGLQDFALVVWNAHEVTAAAPPSRPAFSASGLSTSQVELSWSATAGATSYDLQRSDGVTGPFVTIATPSMTSFTDTGRAAGTTYVYRLRARNATGVSEWALDPATTMLLTDPSLTIGSTIIKAEHVMQLRTMVGAVRTSAGLSAFSWSDDPLVASESRIRTVHLTELRTALNEARVAIGIPPVAFTDPVLQSGITNVKAVHVQEIRDGAR